MARTPLPFPQTPVQDDVPRWCVRRFPAVGTDAVVVMGFDGEGYPLCEARVKVGGDVAMWERAARIAVDAERAKRDGSGPPLPPPRLLALV